MYLYTQQVFVFDQMIPAVFLPEISEILIIGGPSMPQMVIAAYHKPVR